MKKLPSRHITPTIFPILPAGYISHKLPKKNKKCNSRFPSPTFVGMKRSYAWDPGGSVPCWRRISARTARPKLGVPGWVFVPREPSFLKKNIGLKGIQIFKTQIWTILERQYDIRCWDVITLYQVASLTFTQLPFYHRDHCLCPK